ncbi:MAG: septum formation family protein [Acidimicrobiales bacterium]|nr:septum formation family protein [Acidimicrobiales bacterium]
MHRVLASTVLALAAFACADDSGDATASTSSTPSTRMAPSPVAATELVAGDCISGLVVGAHERARIDSAEIVDCSSTHEIEVFATFELAPADFDARPGAEGDTDGVGFPGQQRIVDAADGGCNRRLEDLGEAAAVGLLAVWPTAESWSQGDREVACAVYPEGGKAFEGRGVIGG